MASQVAAIDIATQNQPTTGHAKPKAPTAEAIPEHAENEKPSISPASSTANGFAPPTAKDDQDFVPRPMFHQPTVHSVDIEDYFRGPRDINRHSKWPQFMRMHGSVLPKMIVPLSFVGGWATAVTCISMLVHSLAIDSVLLTVTGFVVGLALSFRSTTAYERFIQGRMYWADLSLNARNLSRLIWVHAQERYEEGEEIGKQDLLAKLAALQLINAFAVSLKHRLRFEPSTEYPDLAPLLANLHTFAGDADQTNLRERRISKVKSIGQYLGVPMAESNPRKLFKQSKDNLGNTPLEVITYLSAYIENIFQNKTLAISVHQVQAMNLLFNFNTILANCERVVNTPLPVAYSISIAQITWAYVMVLPFQLVTKLEWVAIPATLFAAYIILGIAQIGRELENPFGQDVNDLPLDSYCHEIANDIDALTAMPAPLDNEIWMRHSDAKPLWPLSNMEFRAWEQQSIRSIRAALKAKAESKDVKRDRMATFVESDGLSQPGV